MALQELSNELVRRGYVGREAIHDSGDEWFTDLVEKVSDAEKFAFGNGAVV